MIDLLKGGINGGIPKNLLYLLSYLILVGFGAENPGGGADNFAHLGGIFGGFISGGLALYFSDIDYEKDQGLETFFLVCFLVLLSFLGLIGSNWTGNNYPNSQIASVRLSPSEWPFEFEIPKDWKTGLASNSELIPPKPFWMNVQSRSMVGPMGEKLNVSIGESYSPHHVILNEFTKKLAEAMKLQLDPFKEHRLWRHSWRDFPYYLNVEAKKKSTYCFRGWKLTGGSGTFFPSVWSLVRCKSGKFLIVQLVIPSSSFWHYGGIIDKMLLSFKRKN